MNKAEATLLTYQISQRVKKGTYDSGVINLIMANQTTSNTLMRQRRLEFKKVSESEPQNKVRSTSLLSGDNYVMGLNHQRPRRLLIKQW